MTKLLDFEYYNPNPKEVLEDTKTSMDYLSQLLILLEEDNSENGVVAKHMLLHINKSYHQLRMAMYGRALYEDGKWKYGDTLTSKELDDLESHLSTKN